MVNGLQLSDNDKLGYSINFISDWLNIRKSPCNELRTLNIILIFLSYVILFLRIKIKLFQNKPETENLRCIKSYFGKKYFGVYIKHA